MQDRKTSNRERNRDKYVSMEGTAINEGKILTKFAGWYDFPGPSGGSSLMFYYKCSRCGKEYGPNQLSGIKRYSSTPCCQVSKKYGNKRLGYKDITNQYMRSLHYSANKRKIEFEIDAEYIYNLWIQQDKKCRYTGLDISLGNGTMSLDRIDSSRGYVEGNVQWVLTVVNHIKWNMNEEDFIKMCKLIAERN